MTIIVKQSEVEGMGTFTTVGAAPGDHLHTDIAIGIPRNIIDDTLLSEYVIPSEYPYESLIILGGGSFLNDSNSSEHSELANVILSREYDDTSNYVSIKIYATRHIEAGEELFLNYDNITGEEEDGE